jgi:hypothetical protein
MGMFAKFLDSFMLHRVQITLQVMGSHPIFGIKPPLGLVTRCCVVRSLQV